MSYEVDETYDLYSESYPRARKVHKCDACDEQIRVGDKYARIYTVYDDSPLVYLRCLRCQRIHEHLRAVSPSGMWPDEQLNCGEDYLEHWGVEPPEEIAALAFALPGEVNR